ncbi:MAG TPA: zf-HC2 domain-containing protein [Polyangiaceae bacterium]|jgi:hypothetical protein
MTARCTGEAVSWLRLERYHLGEIAENERRSIDAHLVGCPACAACLARIAEDDGVPLPALPDIHAVAEGAAAPPAQGLAARTARSRWLLRASAAAGGALAAAAAVVLFLRAGPRPGTGDVVAMRNHVKGDAVAFSLVRDDGARIDGPAGTFRDGDRFKAVVTCPPGAGMSFDLVVYDRGGAAFPLQPAVDLGCGNGTPLPGAFRLTGSDDENVCLVWGTRDALKRDEMAQGLEAIGASASRACIALQAAAPP